MQNKNTKEKLITLLKSGNVGLMVGAGSSLLLDDPYPSWGGLLNKMREDLLPAIAPFDAEQDDALLYAEEIKNKLLTDNRIGEYFPFLQETFSPKTKNYDDVHVTLVKMPFSGIVTTNFDRVLEDAICSAFTTAEGAFSCDAVDLCESWSYEVLTFLRKLSLKGVPVQECRKLLLHLHGFYRHPRDLILTKSDYDSRYKREVKDGAGVVVGEALDTKHHQVIFSLSAMHPLLFVGFSMEDPAFMKILEIVKVTFNRGYEPIHFVLMPFKKVADATQKEEKAEQEKEIRKLEPYGVKPIFFDVPDGSHDYTGLKTLINEFANAVGVPTAPNTMEEITKDLLRR